MHRPDGFSRAPVLRGPLVSDGLGIVGVNLLAVDQPPATYLGEIALGAILVVRSDDGAVAGDLY